MAEKGSVSINAQNIMPVIKKWLYSDKDIFLREIVSNGCDAISKYKLLVSGGEATETEYAVHVVADEEKGTLSIIDNGIGMTADEVRKYIAQVAFSGATEFLERYKPSEGENGGIIGHFGMGFYSAFMVSEQVTIDTLSWQEGAEAVRWTSVDGMEYEMEPSDRTERGTTVTLKLTEENHEFLHLHQLRETLDKYCAFMPIPIFLSETAAPKAEENADEAAAEKKPEQINDTCPLWMRKPSEVTDEEYKDFYHKVFRDYREPLFWIHLNAEYPFNLKGILYFPKLENEFTASEGVIKLFNNQVFVADNIKEVIPEFLMLLKGAIDCPDLPLNVSRSFLQNDGYVKKMAAYITRKVADRLVTEFNTKREDYEKYWNDIHPFVKYGCMRDEKFYDRVKDAILFKKTTGEFATLADLKAKEETIYYTSDEKRQAHLIAQYTAQDKDVFVLETLIDNNFISFLEYSAGENALKFQRVDASTDGLTEGGDTDETARAALEKKFRDALGDNELDIQLASFKSDELPAAITVDEQSRRFSDMSRHFGGGFQMPEKRVLTLNRKHALVDYLLANGEESELSSMICLQIVDLCEMARQPLMAERMVEFLNRSNKLLSLLAQK
ncbi:MAG: molecular chaperone HtpG [Clostridiales bacterium]|nr:molecular chaperone HtpG [Clostridiales bacterium]